MRKLPLPAAVISRRPSGQSAPAVNSSGVFANSAESFSHLTVWRSFSASPQTRLTETGPVSPVPASQMRPTYFRSF